jgi:hypothetical protein
VSEQNREWFMSGKERADRVMEICGHKLIALDTRRSAIKIYYPTLTSKAGRPFWVDRLPPYPFVAKLDDESADARELIEVTATHAQ